MTSLAYDVSVQTDQERIRHILDAMNLKYMWLDLYNDNTKKLQFLQELTEVGCGGGAESIPAVIINGVYIGGINDL